MSFSDCIKQIEDGSLPLGFPLSTYHNQPLGLAIAGTSLLPPYPESPYPGTLAEQPETLAEQIVWLSSQYHYKVMSDWLWHLLLGHTLQPYLLLKPFIYEKPFAEIAVATFRLAVGVHPRSGNSIVRQFKNPASLWFACQWGNSLKFLENTGFTNYPPVKGKREQYNNQLKILRDLKNHKLKLDPSAIKDYPTGVLLLEAQELAKADQSLDFHYDYLMPFIRTLRRESRKIYECKEIQMGSILKNGSLHRTAKGKKLPQNL
jgi:hypothetical protein